MCLHPSFCTHPLDRPRSHVSRSPVRPAMLGKSSVMPAVASLVGTIACGVFLAS
ncbi:hypothetical protein BDW71DRAFT_184169 [Aspergillus fruticulosus]